MSRFVKFEPLAVSVAAGHNITSAAKSVGCSSRHAYRISGTPEFDRRVGELRTKAADAAVGRLSASAVEAVEVLREIMGDVDGRAADRVTAAKTVLAMLGPLSELHELRARLDRLEQAGSTLLKIG